MRLIGFRGRYIEPILAGTKTTTVRKAHGAPGLPRVGEVVGMRCRYDRPPFVYAQVTEVEPYRLANATDDDAQADGHGDATEWVAAIRDVYGDAPLVRVRWVLLDGPPEPVISLF